MRWRSWSRSSPRSESAPICGSLSKAALCEGLLAERHVAAAFGGDVAAVLEEVDPGEPDITWTEFAELLERKFPSP